jgi:dUTP pyrophosphatase
MALHVKLLRGDVAEFYADRKNHATDSGFDLAVPEDHVVPAKALSYRIPLGVASRPTVQHGYLLMPRSSIVKTPLRQANSIGLIDAAYRGELVAVVDNHSEEPHEVKRGTRLFQIVFPSLCPFPVDFVEELDATERGEGGFGSTGA